MTRNDLPLGFSFSLAQNPEAMKRFSNLPESKQHEILQRASHTASKEEMEALVNSLSLP